MPKEAPQDPKADKPEAKPAEKKEAKPAAKVEAKPDPKPRAVDFSSGGRREGVSYVHNRKSGQR